MLFFYDATIYKNFARAFVPTGSLLFSQMVHFHCQIQTKTLRLLVIGDPSKIFLKH